MLRSIGVAFMVALSFGYNAVAWAVTKVVVAAASAYDGVGLGREGRDGRRLPVGWAINDGNRGYNHRASALTVTAHNHRTQNRMRREDPGRQRSYA